MPQERIALRYMTRFRCLGGECEDTCCRHFRVTIDQAHFVSLAALMRSPEERARFAATFEEKPEGERSAFAWATIRMRAEDDGCPMLGEAGLCGVHQRYGEAALPDVCSFYPRYVTEVGQRLELSGSLSCPEVTRLALLSEDGQELVEVDEEPFGRAPVLQRPTPEQLPWVDELRGLGWMLLDRQEPLAARLYFLAWLAAALAPVIGEGLALDQEAEAATDEAVLAELAAELAGAAPTGEAVAVVFAQIARLHSVVRPALRVELNRALDVAVAGGMLARDGEAMELRAGFVEALALRWGAIHHEARAAIPSWLARYAREFVLRDLGRPGVNLESAMRELIVRVATLRVLLVAHPDADVGEAALGRWFVRLVQGAARVVDHDREVREFMVRDGDERLGSLAALRGVLALL